MSELQTFQNADFGSIRTTSIDGKPYFVGKDIAEVLGYANTTDALAKHVDEEDKTVLLKSQSATLDIPNRGLTMVNESGLYSLVLRSQLPTARKFKRWVTTEVLPAIRRHGVYAIEDIINNPDALIAALTALKEEREKNNALELTVASQEQRIAELNPKATYYDEILASGNTMPTTLIAKDYGLSARQFNELLHNMGIQYKIQNSWFLYQDYAVYGYTQSYTHRLPNGSAIVHTRWTQKGRLFLYEKLKQAGILPVVERIQDEENEE